MTKQKIDKLLAPLDLEGQFNKERVKRRDAYLLIDMSEYAKNEELGMYEFDESGGGMADYIQLTNDISPHAIVARIKEMFPWLEIDFTDWTLEGLNEENTELKKKMKQINKILKKSSGAFADDIDGGAFKSEKKKKK